jgi:iron complex outermembrane receptor protein
VGTNLEGNAGAVKTTEGFNPHHQVSLRTGLQLARNWELNGWLRYVSEIPSLQVNSYVVLDARLAWKPRPDLEAAVVGRNLFWRSHLEFRPELNSSVPTGVERSVYGMLTWRP